MPTRGTRLPKYPPSMYFTAAPARIRPRFCLWAGHTLPSHDFTYHALLTHTPNSNQPLPAHDRQSQLSTRTCATQAVSAWLPLIQYPPIALDPV
jgi:hypothetical protein